MAKSALVTGAYGFVGRYVARQLADEGWRVIGLGHGSWVREEWRTWGIEEWHSTDITLETLITYAGSPQIIMHCGGSGSVGFSMTHPYQDFQRTVATTLAVLEFARMYAPLAKIIYPSSAGVYGVAQKLPILETDPLLPVSPYGTHKRIAEELCESYAKHFNLPVAIVRLFSVYGIGLRKQLLWDASQKVRAGENEFFGTGNEIRDWLHIDDAVHLLITATEHASLACPIVNGASGQGTPVREILQALFAGFGRSDQPNFTGEVKSGDPTRYVADISQVRAWQWQPQKALGTGLQEYVAWVKSSAT